MRTTRLPALLPALALAAGLAAGCAADPPAAADNGPDKKYSSCEAVKKADKGPYYKDKDEEYAWYDDRDHDGVVCE